MAKHFLTSNVSHDLKYLQDIFDEYTFYVSQLILNIFDGVSENLGVPNPDNLASHPPNKSTLQKGFLSGMINIGRRIHGYIGRKIRKSPYAPFKILGRKLYVKGKPMSNREWIDFERQALDYLNPYMDKLGEEMAVKGFLLAMASNEMEQQGKAVNQYGKKSYEQVEREYFQGVIPDTILSAEERFKIDNETKQEIALAHAQVGEYINDVGHQVVNSVRQQIIAGHRQDKSPSEIASDLYWMDVDKPEIKDFTAEDRIRDWRRVTNTEFSILHEKGKLAQYQSQARKSLDNPEMAVYMVFNGSGQCNFCNEHQGDIVRQVPTEYGNRGTDSLNAMGIKDSVTDIAIWIGKTNRGRSRKNWWLCTPSHPWAYSEDTKVLTNKGWKYFYELEKIDKIFSLDPETSIVEYVRWRKLYKSKVNSHLIHFESQYCDFLVTDKHSMLIERRKEIREKGRVKKIFARYMVEARTLLNTSEFVIPRIGKWIGVKTTKQQRLLSSLYGWYVAEGSIGSNKNHVSIRQEKKDNYKKIKDLLLRIDGLEFTESKNQNTFYIKGIIAKEIINNVPDKQPTRKVPQFIKDWDIPAIEAFVQSFCAGDGSTRTRDCFGYESKEVVHYTSSPFLMADMCELIIKVGRAVHVDIAKVKGTSKKFINGTYIINRDMYCIRESRAKRSWFYTKNKSRVSKQYYEGNTYCVNLEKNHVLLVERNGKIGWSGNCADSFSIIHPETQEYDKEMGYIELKTDKSLERFIPKDFTDEIESKQRAYREEQDMLAKRRAESLISQEKKKRKKK